ncbi:MAG: Asp-tRNA(Asn)/Glu-tRNA(Gln) amidotransferase subunit GatB [Patescibacteria group bacterium]
MTTYYPVIGLEVHAEINTKSKMFCRCANDPFASEANTHICPVCTGQPGALPYVNFEAVRKVLQMGVALEAELAHFTEFDRKNYFYPDMPKAYQISQYKYPLVSGGKLKNIDITRIHLEEDTATSNHDGEHSLVDFNRSGVPLMELVTEPVIHTAEQASEFARELQLLIRTLGIGGANLERGEMRIEANISLTTDPERRKENFNPAVEIKNLNSFRIVEQAIEYEINRQTELYNSGGVQIKETRGWDEQKQETFSQRVKETADDYRYFPDPDIPKYQLDEIPEFDHQQIEASLPELPWHKRNRYLEYNLPEETVEYFVRTPQSDVLFSTALMNESTDFARKLANYIVSDLAGLDADDEIVGKWENISAQAMHELIAMNEAGELSSRGTKDVLLHMYQNGGEARNIALKQNLIQQNDEGSMQALVEDIINDNPKQFEQFKAGEEKLIGFFVGQAMKKSGGSANPQILTKILKEKVQ